MNNITTSNTGGCRDVVEMLDFCARHKIGAFVKERAPCRQICLAASLLGQSLVQVMFLNIPSTSMQTYHKQNLSLCYQFPCVRSNE